LGADEVIEFAPPNKTKPARVSTEHRQRLEAYAETSYEDVVDTEGEVFEADVHQRRFQLWKDNQNTVTVSFSEEQEEKVTTALKEHRSLRLRVAGRGEYSPDGRLLKIMHVQSLDIVRTQVPEYHSEVPPIEDVLSSIASEVPQEEWDKLPPDLTDDLDHYLYGTPRR
jgi:hypothetical protein